MNLQLIEELERKVNALIVRLAELRQENETLRRENEDLKAQLRERDQLIRKLEEKAEKVSQWGTAQQQERDQKIRAKVTDLLSKLDNLEKTLLQTDTLSDHAQ